jgi:cobalamin-dependent methionine synthase I
MRSLLIVGELINTSRKAVKQAVDEKDAASIQKLAEQQVKDGATYVDINCGTLINNEEEILQWLVETVQSVVDVPLCIDTPNPAAMKVGLSTCKNGQTMINSISAEKERFETMLPLVKKYKCKVVDLCMDDTGMPDLAEDRYPIIDKLAKDLVDAGISPDDVYFDPLVKPLSTSNQAGLEVLATVRYIKQNYPEFHMICGMSNVSYGLPQRKLLNQAYLVQLMTEGMDGFILDPTEKRLMSLFYASQALLGKDNFCMNYLKAYRAERLIV